MFKVKLPTEGNTYKLVRRPLSYPRMHQLIARPSVVVIHDRKRTTHIRGDPTQVHKDRPLDPCYELGCIDGRGG